MTRLLRPIFFSLFFSRDDDIGFDCHLPVEAIVFVIFLDGGRIDPAEHIKSMSLTGSWVVVRVTRIDNY